MPSNTARLSTFQDHLNAGQACLIANPHDITYLTGFVCLVPEEREALLVVTKSKAHLLYATFSPLEQLPSITYYPGCSLPKLELHLTNILADDLFSELLLDEAFVHVDELKVIEKVISTKEPVKIGTLNVNYLQHQRSKKDVAEIEAITQASLVAAQAWDQLQAWIKPGITELATAHKLESLLLEFGSMRPAFPTIVAFGPHSALPHHQPTDTKLTSNTPVLVDFGATIKGYRSDMTRTMWIGDQPSPEFTQIEQVIQQAYQAALAQARRSPAGESVTAIDIDRAARSLITEAGYGNQFIHTTGHGVGLDIHEPPSLSWANQTPITAGMVITIEPGIYLEGKFGYRYENTVLVGEKEVSELTNLVTK